MMRAVAIACLLLCLAACTSPAPAPQAACTVEKVADLPTRQVLGAVLVPAAVNQTAVQMQVDTGASTSSITPAMAMALRLPPDATHRSTVIGVGGQIVTRNTLVANFEVGRQVWPEQSFVTAPLARAYHEAQPVAGLLGANYLSDFDVELDLPHGRMTLWQVQGCAGDFTWADVPHFSVKLRRYAPARMVASVEIDGHALPALIDWGANTTVLKQTTAVQLGVTPEALAVDPTGHSHGADGNDIEYRVHRFPEIRIGNGVFHQVRVEVAPIQLLDADMLLGLDFARTRRLWLSYATGQMFVALPPRLPVHAN
jgi:predicted aspartyl protease